MTVLRKAAMQNRHFLPADLQISDWKDLEKYASQLEHAELGNEDEFTDWLYKRSELDAILEEDKAWLYIRQSCFTESQEYATAFASFVKQVEEQYALLTNRLNRKLVEYCDNHDYPSSYEIFIRNIRNQLSIFREENVTIQADLEVKEQQYGSITGKMSVHYNGQEHTLQSAQNFLKSTDRAERNEIFSLIWNRRQQDSESLNQLFTELISSRQTIAENAGFNNYLQYRFAQLGRFDYTIEDCHLFHDAVAKEVLPVLNEIHNNRQQKLGYKDLAPYDLEVDPDQLPPLKPFSDVDDLINLTISCFRDVDPEFGEFISLMKQYGYLDLDSRKGKAPGGYNYPLHESNVPFIFMNATNNLRDMETMMHEGGHAIHSFLSRDLNLVYHKDTPAEIAEVASMAMELISMEHWHHFFPDSNELKRAKRSQLEGVISVLPWVATIDKFQHWIYTHPGHNVQERTGAWLEIEKQYSGDIIGWTGLEEFRAITWQKQIHLFQFPLYYIEYGIAQLGAIAIWRNYKADADGAIQAYRNALALGYSKTLPELYEAAGIEFNFSQAYIRSLIAFVIDEYRGI